MIVDERTKIDALLSEYPYLRGWLTARHQRFSKLDNRVLFDSVAGVATIKMAASVAGIDTNTLLDEIREEIARHEIAAEEAAGSVRTLDEGERARRQEVLKGLITELHDGASVEDVKARFDELVRDVDAAEVAQMEQALIAEGMPVEEVQRLCDVHVRVFKESLESDEQRAVPGNHPVDAYRRENEVVGELVGRLRSGLASATAGESDDAAGAAALDELRAGLTELAQIDVHYLRKEHQLFPALERHGVEGPTKVMWGLDDDIRARLKADRSHAERGDVVLLARSLPETLQMIEDMVYKEEKILFPTALDVVTAEEWADIAAGDAEIGYAWVEGPQGDHARGAAVASAPSGERGEELVLPLTTGALSPTQIDLLLRALPFDVTFVDADDRVRYYSEGERVFPRSPSAIGRQVRNCHPPKSLHKVEEILSEFKAGTKDVAEFWIEMGERFIHIRYFAMRGADGTYAGCLEVVHDATHVRSLAGQRRIVDW